MELALKVRGLCTDFRKHQHTYLIHVKFSKLSKLCITLLNGMRKHCDNKRTFSAVTSIRKVVRLPILHIIV